MQIQVEILGERRRDAEKKLATLLRAAERQGLQWEVSWGPLEGRRRRDEDGRSYSVPVQVLTVEGPDLQFGGWEFLARLDLEEDGVLVQSVPGAVGLDPRFRHTNGRCEHCETDRRRSSVFVLRNLTTDRQIQVGRQCLREFLGVDPERALALFKFERKLHDLSDEHLHHGSSGRSTLEILATAATAIRKFGWKPRSAGSSEDEPCTASMVSKRFDSHKDYVKIRAALSEHSQEDEAAAEACLTWAREELEPKSDYEHNLKVLLGRDRLEFKHLGLAVSAVAAHGRLQARRRERAARPPSAWVGQVGQRLRGVPGTLGRGRYLGVGAYGDRYLVTIETEGGTLKWFTGVPGDLPEGTEVLVSGTVKKHDEYEGRKETVISRCEIKRR